MAVTDRLWYSACSLHSVPLMRFIVLDTETTGLSPRSGDRMVEIGAIEIQQRSVQKERVFHHYINPDRDIPEEVVRIHGISNADVEGKPLFPEVAQAFLDFVDGACLVIHNAAFDLGFLMYELHLAGIDNIGHLDVIDTLQLARSKHPQQRNTLDALCDRYGIDRGRRTHHGALLDSELLAEVYLGMTGGRQFSLSSDVETRKAATYVQLPESVRGLDEQAETARLMRRAPLQLNEEDVIAHQSMLERVHADSENQQAIWLLPPMPQPQP
ncbi:MAG: DNA polymerase III subunit epsilon [Mariprofundaceae bacterium]